MHKEKDWAFLFMDDHMIRMTWKIVIWNSLLHSCIPRITNDTVGVADTGPSGLYTPAAIVITTSRPVSFLNVNIEVMGIARPFHTAEERHTSDKRGANQNPKLSFGASEHVDTNTVVLGLAMDRKCYPGPKSLVIWTWVFVAWEEVT